MLRHNRKPQCMLTMTWHWVDLGESVYMELLRSSRVVGSWVVTGKVTQSRKRSDPTTWVTLYYPRQFYHGSCKPSLGLPIKAVCIQILTLPKCPGVTGDSGARVSLPPYDRPLDVWIYGFLFILFYFSAQFRISADLSWEPIMTNAEEVLIIASKY